MTQGQTRLVHRRSFAICFSLSTIFSSFSGDVFVGRKSKENHPFNMPMLGHYIVVAVVKQLIHDYRINRKGVKVRLIT